MDQFPVFRSDSIEKKNDVTAGFSKLMRFLNVFHTSPVAKTCAGDKSALKDDLVRLTSLLQVATSDPSAVNLQDAEAAEQAKSILIKGKNTFQTAITIYPAGVFLSCRDRVQAHVKVATRCSFGV